MVPDHLLFQMPLLSLGLFRSSDFVLIGLFSLCTCLCLRFFSSRKKKYKLPLSPLPKIDDPEFGSRLSLSLRERITRSYHPENTLAHTLSEIRSYAKDHKYLPLLEDLESILYRSEKLSLEARKELLKSLS